MSCSVGASLNFRLAVICLPFGQLHAISGTIVCNLDAVFDGDRRSGKPLQISGLSRQRMVSKPISRGGAAPGSEPIGVGIDLARCSLWKFMPGTLFASDP